MSNENVLMRNMDAYVPLINNREFTPSEVNFSFLIASSPKRICWNREDCFLSDGISLIDYVLVYKNDIYNLENPEQKQQFEMINNLSDDSKIKNHSKRRIFQSNLKSFGLKIEEMRSEFYDENKIIYVLISAPFHVLSRQAEILKLKMPVLNSEEIISVPLFDGLFDRLLMKLFKTSRNNDVEERLEMKLKYRSFFMEEKIECFENCNNPELFFGRSERIRLVYDLLLRTKFGFEESDRYQIGIEKMISRGIYNDAFPLHELLDRNYYTLDVVERTDRELLYEYWGLMRSFWRLQPLDLIKRYFGTKIGIYFAWLGYYTKSLFFPSIIGVIIVIIGGITLSSNVPSNEVCGNYGENIYLCPACEKYCNFQILKNNCLYTKISYIFYNYYSVLFSVIMCIWSALFLRGWKRYHSEISYKWGITDFEIEDETIRPDFRTNIKRKKINPVTKEEEPYISGYTKIFKWLCSTITLIVFICLVIGFGVGIITYKMSVAVSLYGSDNELYKNNAILIASIVTGMANLCFILVLNKIYNYVAYQLTCWECPRTQNDFDNSFTLKVFLFQFVNYYSSLFYIAFVKGKISNSGEQCDPSGCMVELVIQLGCIMIGKQFVAAIIERMLPLFWIWQRSSKKRLVKRQCDKDYLLNSVDKQYLFYEYLEMVIQFGFVTFFAAAFPLAPFFAFINNIIEIRIDAMKFIEAFRRPMPGHTKNIGVWEKILEGMSHLSVPINGCIIAFTSDFIPQLFYLYTKGSMNGFVDYSLSVYEVRKKNNFNGIETCRFKNFYNNNHEDWWKIMVLRCAFVLIFEHVVFCAKLIIVYIIPEIPTKIIYQLQRERFLDKKAVLKQHNLDIKIRKRKLYRKLENLVNNNI
uniref:Anoctamin n=1 Tax=Parastrongyloides trichosuri TaxID=131310 RepID=A0A0N4ZJA1_PARTI